MHEMSIAQGLAEIVHEEMEKAGATSLHSVRLAIGEMSAVVPEALAFGFQVVTAGTRMEGAELKMETVPLRGRCRDCGLEFTIQNHEFLCPRCNGGGIEILSGRELTVLEILVD
ncbi:MAG: hydrogenase maturation nickel metallochaperone HypA [Desulfobacteraceae bacterium]